jgi:hypothetical protein
MEWTKVLTHIPEFNHCIWDFYNMNVYLFHHLTIAFMLPVLPPPFALASMILSAISPEAWSWNWSDKTQPTIWKLWKQNTSLIIHKPFRQWPHKWVNLDVEEEQTGVKGNEEDEWRLDGKGNKMKDKEKKRNIRKPHYYSNINLICIFFGKHCSKTTDFFLITWVWNSRTAIIFKQLKACYNEAYSTVVTHKHLSDTVHINIYKPRDALSHCHT